MLLVSIRLLPGSLCAARGVIQGCRSKSTKSSSSNRYLARQRNDPFVKSRLEQGYVSRSSFKLKELDDSFKFLRSGERVVDLGASPGGWTQVIGEKIKKGGHIIAVDLLPMNEAVLCNNSDKFKLDFYRGDFSSKDFFQYIVSAARGSDNEVKVEVDVVLSDMMVNTSGNAIRDQQGALQLYQSVAEFARQVLSNQGWLILKYFESPDAQQFRKEYLEIYFSKVYAKKPASSRKDSSEMYWICRNLKS